MFSFLQEVEVPEDRKVTIQLPPDAPVGQRVSVKLEIQPQAGKQPRRSLAEWAERNAEDLGPDVRSDDVEGFTGRSF